MEEQQVGTAQSRALAAEIAALNPLSWSNAGGELMAIVDAEFDALISPPLAELLPTLGEIQRKQVERGVKTTIQKTVRDLDDAFEWDWPRMSEATEDFFLDWIVGGKVEMRFEGLPV